MWRRIAYATRYGHASLNEVMALDGDAIDGYVTALDGIVREENRKPTA